MNDQEKREKVIEGLECCIGSGIEDTPGCEDCPYNDMGDTCERMRPLYEDALALLKAQEPRLMTLEEAKSAYVVEYRSGMMREVGSGILDLYVDPTNALYGKVYRVWTSRPTDEQREKEPWK